MIADNFHDDLILGFFCFLPLLIVNFAALVCALFFWRRHPRVSALAFAGALLFFAANAFYLYWEFIFIPSAEFDGAGLTDDLDLIVHWSIPVVQAIGLALLVVAIFIGRTPRGPFFEDE